MRKAAVIVMASSMLACTAETDRPRVAHDRAAIIDGMAATSEQIFSTVAIVTASTGEPSCTGTLVHPTVVVTAAHCLYDDMGMRVADGEMEIVVGALDPLTAFEDQVHFLTETAHPDGYQPAAMPGPLGRDDDIAVFMVDPPIMSLPAIEVLDREAFDDIEVGTPITVSGYGERDLNDPSVAGILYIADTPYQDRSDHEFLAGGEGSPDTCSGDSGGPAYVLIDGVRYLAGATSRASEAGLPKCGRGGLYSIVSAYDDFIAEVSAGSYPGSVSPAPQQGGGGQDGGPDGGGDDDGGCAIGSGRSSPGGQLPAWLGLALLACLATRSRHLKPTKSTSRQGDDDGRAGEQRPKKTFVLLFGQIGLKGDFVAVFDGAFGVLDDDGGGGVLHGEVDHGAVAVGEDLFDGTEGLQLGMSLVERVAGDVETQRKRGRIGDRRKDIGVDNALQHEDVGVDRVAVDRGIGGLAGPLQQAQHRVVLVQLVAAGRVVKQHLGERAHGDGTQLVDDVFDPAAAGARQDDGFETPLDRPT